VAGGIMLLPITSTSFSSPLIGTYGIRVSKKIRAGNKAEKSDKP